MEYPEGLEKNFENLQTFTSHSVGYAGHLKRPRIIKSHLPLKYLSDDLNNAKVIFVARNLKDACVSFYYHLKLFVSKDENRQLHTTFITAVQMIIVVSCK